MKYEYKVVSISTNDDVMTPNVLNEYFSKGWEYVDNITQSVSTGSSTGYSKNGAVAVILRKERE